MRRCAVVQGGGGLLGGLQAITAAPTAAPPACCPTAACVRCDALAFVLMLLRTVRTPQRLSALWRHGLWQQRLLSEGRTAPPLENSFVSDALFAATPLAREIVRHLHSTFNIRFLSHVQKESLPPILEGRDLMCHAPTGTGKTLAYLLPVFHVLMQGYGAAAGAAPRPRPCQAFIFVPNPILAEQVCGLEAPPSPGTASLAGEGYLQLDCGGHPTPPSYRTGGPVTEGGLLGGLLGGLMGGLLWGGLEWDAVRLG